mgnify:CR=1 FL=1
MVAAPMASGEVFLGNKFSGRVALYGKPTPWQATLAGPRRVLRAVQTWGPTMEPCLSLTSVYFSFVGGMGRVRRGKGGKEHKPCSRTQ